jgi:WD40 repeat protein
LASFEPCFGEYINCVQWSPFRPSVFAACSNAGSLYIYDLTQSKQKCIEAIKHENSSISVKLRSAQQIHFNPKQRNLVAVGYDDKFVRVYKLSKNLANKTKKDHAVLMSFTAE